MLPKADAPHSTLIDNWIDKYSKKMNKLYYLIRFHCVNIAIDSSTHKLMPILTLVKRQEGKVLFDCDNFLQNKER
jgi:hypothetical protein